MQETVEFVQAQLAEAGGEMTYQALLDNTPYQHRQYLPQALRHLKAQGIAQRQNVRDSESGAVTLYVRTIQGE
jgi:hypothetical protein